MASLKKTALTVFRARAGDRNERGMLGATSVGAALSRRLGIVAESIGAPEPPLGAAWKTELAAAMPALKTLSAHLDRSLREGLALLTAMNRCAVSLATVPVVMRHRPDTCVVWFDAHADLNTPATTSSGYLGGLALAGPAGLWSSGLGSGLSLASIVLVGARDIDPPEQALIDAGTVRLIPPHGDFASALRQAVGGRPVYMHLDCDVLEPGIVPTEYSAPNGLSLADLRAACEVLAESEVVGLEIAEFENSWNPDGAPVSPDNLLAALQPVIARLSAA